MLLHLPRLLAHVGFSPELSVFPGVSDSRSDSVVSLAALIDKKFK